MSGFRHWLEPRKRSLLWIAAGWASFVGVFAVAWQLWPRGAPIDAPVDRALLALQLAAAPAFVMMAILQGLWRVGDTEKAEDPFANAESQAWKVNHRVFSNTLEQIAIFVPMLVALAIRIAPDQAFALPLLMAIWCVGRVLFWVGYRIEPTMRAIGMDWTSGASVVTALWLIATLF